MRRDCIKEKDGFEKNRKRKVKRIEEKKLKEERDDEENERK